MREPKRPSSNRRRARRLPPRRATQATCVVADSNGPDVLLSLLDLSQTGMRLILKSALAPGDVLELTLGSALLPQPLTVKAETMWSLPLTDGRYCVGARFLQALTCGEVESLAYSYGGAPWLFPTPAPRAALEVE